MNKKPREDLGNIFYVYVWVDPTKPGKYNKYGKDISFNFEPHYVGKGKEDQCFSHFYEARTKFKGDNQHKLNKIRKILREGFTEEDLKKYYIIKYRINLSEQDAWDLEILMIKTIGRADLKEGPLTNMTDGGEGGAGGIMSDETKKKMSDSGKGKHCGEKNGMYERTGGKNPKAKACIVENKPFPAIAVASRKTGLGGDVITYRINVGKEGYAWDDDTPEDIEARRRPDGRKKGLCGEKNWNFGRKGELSSNYGGKSGMAKACRIDGIDYLAIAEASRKTGIPRYTIEYRIKTGKEGYSWADENERKIDE